jgi:N-methylhydantoinase A
MSRRIRIGIDVGGTFTKAIALDMTQNKIIGKITIPTTHSSSEGVSTGIVNALTTLMQKHAIEGSNIELISHSSTQAVNALLEGDTAIVGIIGMGVALEKSSIIKRTNIRDVKLAPNKYLRTCYRFLDTSKYLEDRQIALTISELKSEGAQVLVVSEAYGVDDPSNESFVVKKSDIPTTAGNELTGIYGLEIRTLTAAINASILPKAISTYNFVSSAVRNRKIAAPIMIMKGDGGVTDLKTFQDKPILTILSGPAASVAGALLHLHVLDGVFIEVGGTSTNVCIIKDGKPEIRYVTIMQHPTCIRSLDVRVAGVAGGSLVRWSGKKIIDVGPRSAHIAGLAYSCFANPEELENGQIITIAPNPGDPIDYIGIESSGGKRFAITNTCAANALGLVPVMDYARANNESAKLALSILGKRLGTSLEETAETILEISTRKILDIIEPMIKDYKLRKDSLVFIGGGGGASALVPYLARKLKIHYKVAENAEIISSIGVAVAMIREECEKTVDKPATNDVSALMEEAKDRAIARGASSESVTVQSEYVSERSLLRATAIGNITLDIGTKNIEEIDDAKAKIIATELFGINEGVDHIFRMKKYYILGCEIEKKNWFFKSRKKKSVVVLDKYGRTRLSIDNALVINGSPEMVSRKIDDLLNGFDQKISKSQDLAPQIHLLDDMKIVDFSSLTSPESVSKAVKMELKKVTTNNVAAIVKI